ncbi:hypothetical protein Q3G72_012572 [Acer saccharum]|nr:hypothetical protein Q3G72_012572 [Acer saccharum]
MFLDDRHEVMKNGTLLMFDHGRYVFIVKPLLSSYSIILADKLLKVKVQQSSSTHVLPNSVAAVSCSRTWYEPELQKLSERSGKEAFK